MSVDIGAFRTLARPSIIPDPYVDRLPFYRGEKDVFLSDDSYERTPMVRSGAPTCNAQASFLNDFVKSAIAVLYGKFLLLYI